MTEVKPGVATLGQATALTDPVLRLALYWKSADIMLGHVQDLRAAYPGLQGIADSEEFWPFFTYSSAWLSGLYVVAEGFMKLGLADDVVTPLLGEHVDSLRLYRNATYHFEMRLERHLQFLVGDPPRLNWALDLHEALRVFFLRHVAD